MEINIQTKSDTELKAIAFDIQQQMQEFNQAFIKIINELNRRAQGEVCDTTIQDSEGNTKRVESKSN